MYYVRECARKHRVETVRKRPCGNCGRMSKDETCKIDHCGSIIVRQCDRTAAVYVQTVCVLRVDGTCVWARAPVRLLGAVTRTGYRTEPGEDVSETVVCVCVTRLTWGWCRVSWHSPSRVCVLRVYGDGGREQGT
eukprot:4792324-Prymnesium_polylepis.2